MDNTLKGEFILNSDEVAEKHSDEKASHDSQHTSSTQKTAHHTVSPHFYTAFGHYPKDITFAEQEEGEEIVLILRRHFVTNVPWIAFSIILAILPIFFPFIFSTIPFPDISSTTLSLALAFYYLFIFGFVLLNFTLWYFHIGLITNLRIIDIDLAGILYRQVTAIKHESVEDVTYTQVGFISSLFNYGNVYIQTAGNTNNVEFDRVPRPAKAADIISDLSNPV